jgi:hypothetical protein
MDPIGQNALWANLKLSTPPPHVQSYTAAGTRRTEVGVDGTTELYPKQYRGDDSTLSHIRFALKYEPIDMGVMVAALHTVDANEMLEWVTAEPTGSYARRAWFLYEYFTGVMVDAPNALTGNYVYALDPEKNVVSARQNSARHRVANNLLGTPLLCPTVRMTPKLRGYMASNLSQEARVLTENYDPDMLARAVNYLYTKETKSSFALEGERPNAPRAEKFVAALKDAYKFDTSSKQELINLQSQIVDERYAATDWRDFQNFVGETVAGYKEKIHFICPKPDDVPELMTGWASLADRVSAKEVDPVVAAALVSFVFVFVHPFVDGNGRIHRFLIHHILSKRDFSPPNIIFPVSASIVRDRRSYDVALESFSRPLFSYIDHNMDDGASLVVNGHTAHLYKYFDATAICEYLYDRVQDTIERDLKEELGFMDVFDKSMEAVASVVDMPDKRAALLIKLVLQNGCKLSAGKRSVFEELTDGEVERIQDAIQQIKHEAGNPNLDHQVNHEF